MAVDARSGDREPRRDRARSALSVRGAVAEHRTYLHAGRRAALPLGDEESGDFTALNDLTSPQTRLVPVTLPEAISADAAPAPMASGDGQRACERASDETAERPEQPRRDHRPSLLIADDDAVVRFGAQLKDSFRIIAVADNTTDAKGVAGDALAETLARALHAEV